MHYSYSVPVGSSIPAMLAVFLVLVIILIAMLLVDKLFIDICKEKGCGKTGKLWFIGIVLTPVFLGLYTIALPSKPKQPQLPPQPPTR